MENLDVTARRARLSTVKRKLLARRLRGELASRAESVIPVLCRKGALPVSFAQQRLWFLNQLLPGSDMYNLHTAYRLRGVLNVPALEESLNVIVSRHEALRTTFASSGGRPEQVITPALRIELRMVDLEELAEEARNLRMLALAGEEAHRPFDLSHGPLVRCAILRLSADDHVILLTMHHIISDGWSLGIFFRELAALYQERNGGGRAVLPELPLQYADFAAWQRERLARSGMEKQLAYWRTRLADASVLDLPLDCPRPPTQTFSGASISATLPGELTLALRDLAQSENVTLFVILLAAFQVLLSRHAGQEDVVIGTPMAGRSRHELENVIGLFVNTLVIRVDLSGAPTFREMLRCTREAVVGAYENQDVPFEMLVEILQPERDLSRSPLFQVFFNMISFVDERLELAGLIVEPLAAGEIRSKFDLTLYAGEREETLNLFLLYNPDLFCHERMADWLRQFHNLLWQIVDTPDRSLSDYSLLSQAAAGQLPNPSVELISKWEGSVHQFFAKKAAQRPAQIALTDAKTRWTYQELADCSDHLANCLQSHEISRGDTVAVYARRCAPLVPALLGILKAGAAFLVLDSAYPTAALIERLTAARPRACIQLADDAPLPGAVVDFFHEVQTVGRLELPAFSVALMTAMPSSVPASTPAKVIGPEDLAYVAFTSGTTGGSHGILGSHGPLAHFIRWHSETYQLGPADRFAMLSGLAHDPLLRDVFTPLSVGATLCIPGNDDLTLPGQLAQWLRREKISVLHLTPGVAQITALADKNTSLPDLRYAFFAADTLTRRDVTQLHRMAPNATFVNFYGATETPQAIACYAVPRDLAKEHSLHLANMSIPLGRGIEGVQLLVLNAAGGLCGIGELGEIHVRTPYLAKGYLADEALTRERFITNPFTGVEGDRLYRTGDFARYLPTGDVDFAGRLDDQIKIRGFRVEPRMVEAVLNDYPGVSASAVVARIRAGGERQLIAYVAAEFDIEPGSRTLADFLRERLPEFMVPTAFVTLPRLPLTPNGKLDRSVLPDPSVVQPSSLGSFTEPRTAMEQKLADIWSELLGVNRVSADDNFFELGGHSLLAMRLLSKVSTTCDVDLPLRAVFDHPTLAALAAVIAAAPSREQKSLVPALKRVNRKHSPLPQGEREGNSEGNQSHHGT